MPLTTLTAVSTGSTGTTGQGSTSLSTRKLWTGSFPRRTLIALSLLLLRTTTLELAAPAQTRSILLENLCIHVTLPQLETSGLKTDMKEFLRHLTTSETILRILLPLNEMAMMFILPWDKSFSASLCVIIFMEQPGFRLTLTILRPYTIEGMTTILKRLVIQRMSSLTINSWRNAMRLTLELKTATMTLIGLSFLTLRQIWTN